MNTFQEYDDIFGRVDIENLAHTLMEFFEVATETRKGVGDKAYLLDKYISYLLEAANEELCIDVADNGFKASGAHKISLEILNGNDTNKKINFTKR